MSLYWHWANDCRVYPQRRLRSSRQPPGHYKSGLILWRHDTLQPNPGVLEILVSEYSTVSLMIPWWFQQFLTVSLARIYYLDPFNYLMSSLLVFTSWDKPVRCRSDELAVFDPAPNQTCQEYLSVYQQGMGAAINLLNPEDTDDCRVCQYTQGGDYLRTLNLNEKYYGWRNAGIVVVFVIGCYGLVFVMMKLRTKATKKAES